MSFQIINSKAPNYPSNTCVFSIFKASDSVTNLKVIGDKFWEEIGSLQNHTWNITPINCNAYNSGKKMKVFICKDYEFETRFSGISGASGKSLC